MQMQLLQQLETKPQSLCDRLAEYFRSRPNVWIDGMEIARIAGSYAWRTRVSDLRRKRGMVIENEVAVHRTYRRSFYRYVREEK